LNKASAKGCFITIWKNKKIVVLEIIATEIQLVEYNKEFLIAIRQEEPNSRIMISKIGLLRITIKEICFLWRDLIFKPSQDQILEQEGLIL